MTVARPGTVRHGAVRHGAIVGFGNVALHGHVPGWLDRPAYRIVAVVDPDELRCTQARDRLPGVRTYPDTDALFTHERLDFVDIAAPPSLHLPAILAAVHAGTHVLCEKPLVTVPADHDRIRAAAADAGVVVHTVHNWTHSEAFAVVRRVLAAGEIGTLTSIAFETLRNGAAVTTGENWRMQPAVAGGGILVDHGWHAFYLLLAMTGQRPRHVRATTDRRRYREMAVEDTAHCAVDFPSVTATIDLTWAAAERRTAWRLTGTAGELAIIDDRVLVQTPTGTREATLHTSLSAGSHHPEWFAGVIDDFAGELDDPAVRGRNLEEAGVCVRLLAGAYASAAHAGTVQDVTGPDGWGGQ